ncbi:MAG: hypothetical protein WC804_09135 [Sphingomonas sp.]|jgi:hypothetical protein|uniref:hypothetical protein n=1 Tax=Sphingomonas sp. TaxID=28214 RepID=UPI0035699E85
MKIWTSLKVSIVSLALAAVPSASFATPTYSGLNTITAVVAFQSGNVLFTIGSAPNSPWSTCNVNHQFVINTSTASGAALYQNIIRAEQDAKHVYVVGKGTCTLISGAEDVDFVQIDP